MMRRIREKAERERERAADRQRDEGRKRLVNVWDPVVGGGS